MVSPSCLLIVKKSPKTVLDRDLTLCKRDIPVAAGYEDETEFMSLFTEVFSFLSTSDDLLILSTY